MQTPGLAVCGYVSKQAGGPTLEPRDRAERKRKKKGFPDIKLNQTSSQVWPFGEVVEVSFPGSLFQPFPPRF